MSIACERNLEWVENLANAMLDELGDTPDVIALRAASLLKNMVEQRWRSRDKKGSSRTGMGMD